MGRKRMCRSTLLPGTPRTIALLTISIPPSLRPPPAYTIAGADNSISATALAVIPLPLIRRCLPATLPCRPPAHQYHPRIRRCPLAALQCRLPTRLRHRPALPHHRVLPVHRRR